jgi:hypothetical protein
VQTKHVSLLEEPLVSSGRFSFVPPAQVVWKVEKPEPLEVKIDGDRIEIPGMSDEDRRHVSMTPIAGMFRQLGAIFTGALGRVQEEFEVTAGDSAGVLALMLVPRHDAGRKVFQRIDLRFVRPALTLERIEIREPLGDRLVVELKDVERIAGDR